MGRIEKIERLRITFTPNGKREQATSEFQKPTLSKWGQVHNLSCENEFYFHIKGWALNLEVVQRPGELGNGLFVPRDEVFPLIINYCLLLLLKTK